jgi:phospholipid-translocating ATPase
LKQLGAHLYIFCSIAELKLIVMVKAVAPPKPRNNAQKQSSGFRRFLTRLVEFDIAKVFSRAHVPGPPRTVFVNEPLPNDYRDPKGRIKKEHVFITNQVITSKYTVITFLPRNLLEQFRRVANM